MTWRLMYLRMEVVWLMNFAPKAVAPVLLVASSPSARLELPGMPKLIWPPVVWSPEVAPKRPRRAAEPYQPAIWARPRPPGPVALAGNAKSSGLAREYVVPLIVTGLAVLTEVMPGLGRESKSCV